MPGCLLSPSQEVRYKNRKDTDDEDQDEEILISSLSEGNTNSGGEVKNVPRLTFIFFTFSITILIILFVALGTLYYCTDILRSSHRGSCLHLHQVNEVVVEVETTDFKSCSDNKTCHLFLEVIEKKHDGLKYNFVIGPNGELYIGAGFKCLVNSDKNALYVKFLRSELEQVYTKACDRFNDIIKHGVLCNKISPNFNLENETSECPLDLNLNPLNHYLMSKYPVIHDPGHDTKFIHENFRWTTCGSLATTENVKKGKVITLESLQNNSCSPLQLVDEVVVDVEKAPRLSCYSHSTCLQEYEEYHDGLKYNFIISHKKDIYVGLGFKCNADKTSNNTLRIKVLREHETSHPAYNDNSRLVKYLLILEEGIACGKIAVRFSVKVNYNHFYIDDPEQDYKSYTDRDVIKRYLVKRFPDLYADDATVYSEEREFVWDGFRYRICQRKESHNTTSPTYQSSTDTDHTTITPETCIPYKKVDKVRIITEKSDYLCQNNSLNCPSLLNKIEKDHNGLKYNFVIGPKGQLYIGTGFKCMANSEENALHVKLLISTMTTFVGSLTAVLFRLKEIIEHGIMCGKISKSYTKVSEIATDHIHDFSDIFLSTKDDKPNPEQVKQSFVDNIFALTLFHKNRSDHIHDPNYTLQTIIPESSTWTFCEDFSNKTYVEDEENPQDFSCPPLQLVDQVDVACTDMSLDYPYSCHSSDYNLIMGQDQVCVGSGFHCKAKHTSSNVFKILVSKLPGDHKIYMPLALDEDNVYMPLDEHRQFSQVINWCIACGSITRNFTLRVNCTECSFPQCKGIREEHWEIDDEENSVTISFKNGDYSHKKWYLDHPIFKLEYQLCPNATYGEMVQFPPKIETVAPTHKNPDHSDNDYEYSSSYDYGDYSLIL